MLYTMHNWFAVFTVLLSSSMLLCVLSFVACDAMFCGTSSNGAGVMREPTPKRFDLEFVMYALTNRRRQRRVNCRLY